MSTKELQTIILSDGRKVEFEEMKGRHLLTAQKACSKKPFEMGAWMLSKYATLDGQAMTIEDWSDLPLSDFSLCQNAILGEKQSDESGTEGK